MITYYALIVYVMSWREPVPVMFSLHANFTECVGEALVTIEQMKFWQGGVVEGWSCEPQIEL